MANFTSNPIVIKKDGRPNRLLELKLDLDERSFLLEIYDRNRKMLQKEEVTNTTFISLNESLEEVIFVYKDLKTKAVLTEEKVNIKKVGVKSTIKNITLIEELEEIVKNEMDFPKGTQNEIKTHTEMLKKAITDKNARIYVNSKIRQIIISSNLVKGTGLEQYVYEIYSNLYGMGVIQELDDDIDVGEIMVNAAVFPRFRSDIYYIKKGIKYKYDKGFRNLDELKQVFSRCVEFNKKELNAVENPIVEATRENKDRVNIIIPEASENYILNIRKFSNFVPDAKNMKISGTIDDYMERLFNVLIKGKANIGIGGAMGTGKTTLINYLLTHTDPIERKVVIASVSETDVERVLQGHDVVIFNVNEEKGFTFEKLMRASLRTTASRVVVPESRGNEFKQIYEANLKTKGNLFTGHALDDESFLDVCCDMYGECTSNIKDKIAKSVDIVVIMRKVGDKIRVKSISEVIIGEDKKFKCMNSLYEWVFDPERPLDGHYKRTSNRLSDALKSRLNENCVPMSMLEDL